MRTNPKRSLPFTNDIHSQEFFEFPWQGQLFAITVHLSEQDTFSWDEFVNEFGHRLKKSRNYSKTNATKKDYYYCWLGALEQLIIDKKLGNSTNLLFLKSEWEKAFLCTPHGSPVKI